MAKKPATEAAELAAPAVKKQSRKKDGKITGKAPEKKANVVKTGKNYQDKPQGSQAAVKKQAAPAEETKKRKPHKQLTPAEWRKIRLEYVKGKTTFAKLAEKYGVSSSNIRKRASLEHWTKKRSKLDAKVEQKAVERIAEARARELEKLAAISDRVDDILDAVVDAVGQLKVRRHDDMRGLESLTKAVQISLQTKRDLYNLPNETDRAKIESLREKAKLDRQKYEDEKAEKAKLAEAAGNTMIRVVIEGEGGALDE